MEKIAELIQQNRNTAQSIDYSEYLQLKCDSYNNTAGKLTGYDCKICKNKGYISVIKDCEEYLKECDCLKIRRTLTHIKNSGLQHLYDTCTLDTYTVKTAWQKAIRKSAEEYTKNPEGWYYIGGQSGAGKTHICAAILHRLLEQGKECRYMMWRDDVQVLKADFAGYESKIKPYKEAEVLYIDDFFKCGDTPTASDINIAFEVINHRVVHSLITLISSEYTINDIKAIDTATAGRIYEKSKKHCICLKKDEGKNMRFSEG